MKHSLALLTALLLAPLAALHAAEPSARKPNFIFIITDDMSWGNLGCFGHPYAKTPNLDRMAAEGIKFTQFYACGPECAPARPAHIWLPLQWKDGKPLLKYYQSSTVDAAAGTWTAGRK